MSLEKLNTNEKCKDCPEFWQSESHKKSNNPFGWCAITNDGRYKDDECNLSENLTQNDLREIKASVKIRFEDDGFINM